MSIYPKGNIRYRLSPEVAAELNFLRSGGGYRSWDDFFSAMICKWRQAPSESVPVNLQARLDKLGLQIKGVEHLCRKAMFNIEVRGIAFEGLEGTIQSLASTQEQLQDLLQQFTTLLSIAFGDDEPKKVAPTLTGAMGKLQERIRKRSS